MDYSRYSRQAYMALFGMFDSISEVLAGKLRQMERQGFSPDRGFIFGFSYGGRLALEGAHRYGPKRIKQIDSKINVVQDEGVSVTLLLLQFVTLLVPCSTSERLSWITGNRQRMFSAYSLVAIRDPGTPLPATKTGRWEIVDGHRLQLRIRQWDLTVSVHTFT